MTDNKLEFNYFDLGRLLTDIYKEKEEYKDKQVEFSCFSHSSTVYHEEETTLAGELVVKRSVKVRDYETTYTKTESYDEKEMKSIIEEELLGILGEDLKGYKVSFLNAKSDGVEIHLNEKKEEKTHAPQKKITRKSHLI